MTEDEIANREKKNIELKKKYNFLLKLYNENPQENSSIIPIQKTIKTKVTKKKTAEEIINEEYEKRDNRSTRKRYKKIKREI